MIREMTIMAAKDGGFVVLDYGSDPGSLKLPLFAGDLDQCLDYAKAQLGPRVEDKKWEA